MGLPERFQILRAKNRGHLRRMEASDRRKSGYSKRTELGYNPLDSCPQRDFDRKPSHILAPIGICDCKHCHEHRCAAKTIAGQS